MQTIPLFPLNLVLFPGAVLPLRIFEPRYTDMVSECLRTDSGFGVCLIKQGQETGGGARCYEVGTYARIIDWSQLEDGLLGITAAAQRRFRVLSFAERRNLLLEGDIQWLEEDDHGLVGDGYEFLQTLLLRIFDHYGLEYEEQDKRLEDASWLGYRLAELLPLQPHTRQALLEMDDSAMRLARIQTLLDESNISDLAD